MRLLSIMFFAIFVSTTILLYISEARNQLLSITVIVLWLAVGKLRKVFGISKGAPALSYIICTIFVAFIVTSIDVVSFVFLKPANYPADVTLSSVILASYSQIPGYLALNLIWLFLFSRYEYSDKDVFICSWIMAIIPTLQWYSTMLPLTHWILWLPLLFHRGIVDMGFWLFFPFWVTQPRVALNRSSIKYPVAILLLTATYILLVYLAIYLRLTIPQGLY